MANFYCALFNVHCTLYTVQCALYTVHCTLCTVHCALYRGRYEVCSVQCKVGSEEAPLCRTGPKTGPAALSPATRLLLRAGCTASRPGEAFSSALDGMANFWLLRMTLAFRGLSRLFWPLLRTVIALKCSSNLRRRKKYKKKI